MTESPPPLKLDEILAEARQLPSLPSIVIELARTLRDEDADIGSLAAGIAKDQALAARALRVANSSFYGMQRHIGSIHDAILVLGFGAVTSLVTAAALIGHFKPMAEAGFDLVRFWRHGLGAALAGRALAGHAGLDPGSGFTAGLLHDIGRLLLVTTRPRHYAQTLAHRAAGDVSLAEAERQVLGLDHAEVGAALAGNWRFPADIRAAVAGHHAPPDGASASLTDVAHVADVLAHALDLAGDPQAMVPPLDRAAWRRLGLEGIELRPLLAGIEEEHERYCALLSK